MPLKPRLHRLLDRFEGRSVAEFPVEAGDAFPDRVDFFGLELLDGDSQAFQHGFDIEVDQHRALKEERPLALGPARPRDLAAVDFDIVARAKSRLQAQDCQGSHHRLAERLEKPSRGEGKTEEGLVTDDFPAELALIEEDRSAPGDAPVNLDPVNPAVFGADLFLHRLMESDQRGFTTKLEEMDGIRRCARPFQFNQNVIQRHIFRRAHRR